jgi:hypothetical protein
MEPESQQSAIGRYAFWNIVLKIYLSMFRTLQIDKDICLTMFQTAYRRRLIASVRLVSLQEKIATI